MILLDTSFLYAFFQENDNHHKEAIKIAKEIADKNPIFIPIEVLEELMTVVTRKDSSKRAIQIAEIILAPNNAIGILNTHELVFDNAYEIFKKLSPHNFSFVDCILISLIQQNHDSEIISFDKSLLNATS